MMALMTDDSVRAEPAVGIDIATLDHLTELEAVEKLGVPRGQARRYVRHVRDARKVALRRRELDVPQCEAAVPNRLGLRCEYAAIPDERWCRRHHPRPPEKIGPHELGRIKPRTEEEMLEALQSQAVLLRDLAAQIVALQSAFDSIVGPAKQWMSTTDATTYTGRSSASLSAAIKSGAL
ncbi:MAG: hypothetical protein JWN31_461, partial [Frankiales bacterium]|nr:hypothetical protein [Frankiales bacterium]